MPLREGTKKIATNPPWASAPTADRTDPDDATLTPALVIANGWPATFSADAGDTPRRAVFNEMYWRRSSAIKDIINYGILPWDADVDTLQGGTKQVSGVIYGALVDNGPTYSNAVNPTTAGQTVWQIVSGTIGLPSAPAQPTATAPASGELDWSWNCPLDGGAAITSFNFYWRTAGTLAFSAAISVTTPRHVLTGLPNGAAIEAQVEAVNAQGPSPPSAVGSATPQGTVPGGGATLALRATAGDAEVDLDWLEPDTGGLTITQYIVQWRAAGQAFSTGRQATISGSLTAYTRDTLTNGTAYFFQIRARNSQGVGQWSNEASATPMAVVVPPMPPADTAPDAPTSLAGTPRYDLAIDWLWELPDDNGGQRISSYDFQWRYSGDGWAAINIVSALEVSYYRLTIANTTRGVDARVRASNSVGTSGWSGTATVASGALLGTQLVAPPPPSAPSGAARDPRGIRWTWTPPTGWQIIDHEVQTRVSGAAWPDIANVQLATAQFDYSGITIGTTYQARARARRTQGASDWSNAGSFTAIIGGSRVYIADDQSNAVQVYDLSGTRQTGEEFTVATTLLRGISVSGSRVYIADAQSNAVQVYDLSGTRQTGEEFTVATTLPLGISVSGSRVYIADAQSNAVQVYDLSGTRQTGEEFTVATIMPYGISVSGSRVYIADSDVPDSVQVYDLSGTRQTGEEFTVATTLPLGISVSGSRVYIADSDVPDSVQVYDLSGTRQTGEEFTVATIMPLGISVVIA